MANSNKRIKLSEEVNSESFENKLLNKLILNGHDLI